MAMSKKEVKAIKLPFETGEHLVTWKVPGNGDSINDLPGLFTIDKGKYPAGILYGEMPIIWQNGAVALPQTYDFSSLHGDLSSGSYVALMNGQLSYWFSTQGRAVGAFAVLSQREFKEPSHRRYRSIEIQVEGLESVVGAAPIASVKMPIKKGDEQTYSANLNTEADFEWDHADYRMSLTYRSSARILDPYEFIMEFGPVLRITSPTALTALDWWIQWVNPIRRLISLMTGAPREVRYVLLSVEDAKEHRWHYGDQLFGWDITQEPVNSNRDDIQAIHSSINLAEDHANFLDMIMKWQELTDSHHPLFETYGEMVTATGQHPRSRFLLLLQALEGSYGFENRAKFETDKAKYVAERSRIICSIESLTPTLSTPDLKFLKKHLQKEPPHGLESALAQLIKRLPNEMISELEGTEIVKTTRKKLESDGRRSQPLQTVLTRIRNILSHGSGTFDTQDLAIGAEMLERVVRAEAIRLLGLSEKAQKRALKKSK